jgi:hypothetical protein
LNVQLPATAKWAASLPAEVQLPSLLQKLPRIANALARLWQDDVALRQYLDDLLVDRRGSRQGFPPDIHLELVLLREFSDRKYRRASSSA